MKFLGRLLTLCAAFALMLSPVHAGTPLICHPYAIGDAKSLPNSVGDWKGVNPAYDRANLLSDTLAILKPDTPVIVRMETLRRAAIYATAGMRGWSTKGGFTDEDRAQTTAITEKLKARAESAKDSDQALALFDYGFFVETLRHTRVDSAVDGYAILTRALALRGADAEMEFALALASSWPNRREKEQAEHLSRARAGAKPGSLLAANLATHFGRS